MEAELELEEPMEMGGDASTSKDEGDRGIIMASVENHEPTVTSVDGGQDIDRHGDVTVLRKRAVSLDAAIVQEAKWVQSPRPSEGQVLGAEELNARLLEKVTRQEEGLSILENTCLELGIKISSLEQELETTKAVIGRSMEVLAKSLEERCALEVVVSEVFESAPSTSMPAVQLAEVSNEVQALISDGMFYGTSGVLTLLAMDHPDLDFPTIYRGKTRAKNEKLELENDSLIAKYDIAKKASGELREENKIVSCKLKELREKHDKLEGIHNELITSYNLLNEEYTNLKINYDNLVFSHEFLSTKPHDATNNVVKIDIATSCDDLIIESIEQSSSSKGKKVVESDNFDDYVKLKNENEKLKKDLEKLSTTNTIVIENLDNDHNMALENEMLREENKRLKLEKDLEKLSTHDELREENKRLKLEKEHLKTGLRKFTSGQYLQSELIMNTVMKMDRSGIGFLANQ
ncbi:filament-like plant protein 1 [Miscanthus floridulus]|uniref:filament-like plant protein 1 n=1 Tax=Miscanthus floridulus TaxID=154761 RepID=UPI00345845C2